MTSTATPGRRGAAGEMPERRDSTTINLRIPVRTRDLIDTAASVVGKSRTEFMIETARRQAIDVLLDQRLFELTGDELDAFNRALDEPVHPNENLEALFKRKPAWAK